MSNLTEILSHLPKAKVRELEVITRRIVGTGKAEIVVLFGSYARGDYKEQRGKDRGKKSDYDILVLTANRKHQKALRSNLRDLFEDIDIAIQVIVESIGFVNDHLEEQQYFFTDIKREGKVLYDSGRYKLANSKELPPTRRREMAEEDFNVWFGQANEMFDHYLLDQEKNYLGSGAFHLQQVVEMCYTAIEMVFTHYNPHEHNLEVLRRRILKFDPRLNEILPRETGEQQKLFDHLNFAYIGGRYRSKEEFPVTSEQLNYWGMEAQKLLSLTKTICQERIESLKVIEHKLNTNS